MKIRYKSNKLMKQLGSPTEIKKAFGNNAKRVQSRLDDIESSPNLAILMQIPAANCHQLSGKRKDEWALNISPNHRMIFELAHDPVPRKDNGEIDTINVTEIQILETTDYH